MRRPVKVPTSGKESADARSLFFSTLMQTIQKTGIRVMTKKSPRRQEVKQSEYRHEQYPKHEARVKAR